LTGLLLLDHPGILEAIIDYPFWGLYAEGVKTKGQVNIHLREPRRIAGLGHGHRDRPYEISPALVANFGPGWTILPLGRK
jgi:hypothetical protein